MKKLLFLFLAASYFLVNAQTHPLPPRPGVLAQLVPFYHGVASGDPLSDRVIIWTRVTTTIDSVVNVSWQMATDTAFSNIINSATVSTDSSVDYTVKVDVTGLQSNTWYYYRFKTGGTYSITGRTRTIPVGNVDSLRFAFFSCSNFQAGYFNAYRDIASRNDIDAIIHLGDWYYEYAAGGYGYINDTSRLHSLNRDVYTYDDYILQHSQYKLDLDLRAMLQQYPLISIWDDHETANNSWYSGAQNHNPATQGDWFVRKAAAFKAYFQWMPIRPLAPGNDSVVHRAAPWGNLLNMIMLDTRYEGRDSSLGTGIPTNDPYMTDTNRRMLGVNQLAWFKTELSDATTQWKIVGNQVMISALVLGTSALNCDQWDGYPAERKRVYDHIMQHNIKDVVFITGDIHSSWASDLPYPDSTYVAATGAGSVATEFIGSSITSPGVPGVNATLIESIDPYFKYVDLTLHGYGLLDVNKQRAQCDWIHMSTVTSRTYTASDDAQWMNLDGERFLRQAPGLLGPRPANPPLLPVTDGTTGIKDLQRDNMVIISCYPNPSANEVSFQYYLFEPAKVDFFITNLNGQLIYKESMPQSQAGLFNTKARLDNLAAGTYLLSISANGQTYSKQVVKVKQ